MDLLRCTILVVLTHFQVSADALLRVLSESIFVIDRAADAAGVPTSVSKELRELRAKFIAMDSSLEGDAAKISPSTAPGFSPGPSASSGKDVMHGSLD